MNNCCLKYTDWLSDLTIKKEDITFRPDLGRLIQPFEAKYSGIWRPLITNTSRVSSQYLLPYNTNPKDTGIIRHISEILGYNNFITFNNPTFKNWTVTNVEPVVDIGMTFENTSYYMDKNNRNSIQSAIQSKKNFSTQTINVIRNKLNDEATVQEKQSISGNIPRISQSAISKTTVISSGKTQGLDIEYDQLLQMFTPSISGDGLDWTFDPGSQEAKLKYLSTNDYLILDYTVFTEKMVDNVKRTGQYSVRIYLFGVNDEEKPRMVSDTGSAEINLAESTSPPYTTGFFEIEDLDLSQQIHVYIEDVRINGPIQGLRSSKEDIKKMLVVNRNLLRDSTTSKQKVQWSFNGGPENFGYLKQGDNLALEYKLYIYDNLGKYLEYNKTIIITGKNDPPAIGIYNISDSSGGIFNLNNSQQSNLSGTLSVDDIDNNDSINASVISVGLQYSTLGAGSNPYPNFLSMLTVSGSRQIQWQFNPNKDFLKYLSAGQIVKANYIVKATDGGGANSYATVSILIIGKNEDVETSLNDIDVELQLPEVTRDLVPSTSLKNEREFSVSDDNKNDSINIFIAYYKYHHEGLEPTDTIPDNLDISTMLYFHPVEPRNINKTQGSYKMIFDTSPQSFSYLNNPNKKIIIYYQVVVTDSGGSYKIKNVRFTIKGPQNNQQTYQPDKVSTRFSDYVWGWYRYYDLGRKDDNRHIPGVDFYFDDLDTFLFYGEPEFLIANSGNYVSLPSGYRYVNANKQRLTVNNNLNDLTTLKNLERFFPNPYDRKVVLALLKTHPGIDLVTMNLTDTDGFSYTRDENGRILPILSGLSVKDYNDVGVKKFVSKTEDIAYRLANKYGLRMVVRTNAPANIVSKFKSCVGPNIGIQQINKIFRNKDSTELSFLDVGVSVGNTKYDKQLAKQTDNSSSIIKLDVLLMGDSPIIDYSPCKLGTPLDQTDYDRDYSIYNASNYFFYIVDYRLNRELFHQKYFINNTSGNYSKINESVDANVIIDMHGHGGIKDRCLQDVTRNVFFDPYYAVEDNTKIEGTAQNITFNYFANPNSEGEIGNINIEYLRSPNKSKCRSFISEDMDDIDHTHPTDLTYDFRNKYFISRAYIPSVTSYYMPPSGFFYANLYAPDKDKIGINLKNHPAPRSPLIYTHNLAHLNPIYDTSSLTETTDLLTVSYNGDFDFDYNIGHLPAGRLFLYCVCAASGASFKFSLPTPENELSKTATSSASGIETKLFLEFNPQIHDKAKVEVNMPDLCDNWSVKLYHEKFDYLELPLISKIEFDTSIGFFHPNSGWLDTSANPKYLYKTPMAPYVPSVLKGNQSGLQKKDKIRPDHYFWYDCDKMYAETYLDGINFIIDTSGTSKPIVDMIDKAQYIGFPQENGNWYYVTPDFYTFNYTEEDSPIRQSIKMSYAHLDYSYWYPFNDFVYTLANPKNPRQIIVSSLSDKKRCFAYFDDSIYARETVVLTNHETINIDNQILSINQVIGIIENLISIARQNIQYFNNQITQLTQNITISQQERNIAIQKLQSIINILSNNLLELNNNINTLRVRSQELTQRKNSLFSTTIASTSGNNDGLVLNLSSPLPPHLLQGGFIKKAWSDKPQSYLLYRSNYTRNDPEITVGKWGNIVAGKDADDYNNSIIRQKSWTQSSLFFNYNSQGIIQSSGYYFPYSYTSNKYNISGSKIYDVVGDSYNETYNFQDVGLISSVSGRLHSYIYAGPYKNQVLITRVPKQQLVQIKSGKEVANYLTINTAPSGISDYGFHNLRGGDTVKFIKTSGIQKTVKCFSLDTSYFIANSGISTKIAHIGSSATAPIVCSEEDVDIYTTGNIFIMQNINPTFNVATPCLGSTVIKYGGSPVEPIHDKNQNVPVFYELDYKYKNIFPYLSDVMAYHCIGNAPSTNSDHHIIGYDKFLGNIDGLFFTYINDSRAQDRNGLIKSTRYTIYNHNDSYNINEYSNIVGDDSPRKKITNPSAPAGLDSLLLEQIDNNNLLDVVIDSLQLQISTLQQTMVVLQQNLNDSGKNNVEKERYRISIQQTNNQINYLQTELNRISGARTQPTPKNYVNWNKIPRQVNVGFPENKYKTKNPYIDMHIYSSAPVVEDRFFPTKVGGFPGVSGYVYFEGLVEPPLHDFYRTMRTPYNPYKKWIDIPKNAKWGIMHKNGKVFWQNTIYSVQKSFKTSCDSNASQCDRQKPSDKNVCGEAKVLNSSSEFFNILKLPLASFETQDVTLPDQCANLNFCCTLYDTVESSNAKNSIGYNTTSQCNQDQAKAISECSKMYHPQNSGLYLNIFCFDRYCPVPSGSGGYPIGSLSGTNYGIDNTLGGGTVVPISGRADITGESFFMFRLNPVDIRQFLVPGQTKKITFINSSNELDTPNIRSDNILFNHVSTSNDTPVPFNEAGYLTVESGNKNPQWIQKHCSYRDMIEPGTYYFKDINDDNSNFIALKSNNSGLIWQNEMLYRDNVNHSGCFYGFMGEYDVYCHLNNNPFYKAELLIEGKLPNYKAPTKSSSLCNRLINLKSQCVSQGDLYEVEIADGNYFHKIKVSLESENDRFLTQYKLDLANLQHTVKIHHDTNRWDYLLYRTKSNCPSGVIPEKTTLFDCYDSKRTFEIMGKLKAPTKTCPNIHCPDDWIYCADEAVHFTRVYVKTKDKFGFPQPKCPPGGVVRTQEEWKTEDKTYKLGRSLESCQRYVEEVGIKNAAFPHSFDPKNYFYNEIDYSAWLCFNEPDYASCYDYPSIKNPFGDNTQDTGNYMTFKINVFHNLLEIVLPSNSLGTWPESYKNKNKFYIQRDSANSLFPVIKVNVKNSNISIVGNYSVIKNKNNYLGEIILDD